MFVHSLCPHYPSASFGYFQCTISYNSIACYMQQLRPLDNGWYLLYTDSLTPATDPYRDLYALFKNAIAREQLRDASIFFRLNFVFKSM